MPQMRMICKDLSSFIFNHFHGVLQLRDVDQRGWVGFVDDGLHHIAKSVHWICLPAIKSIKSNILRSISLKEKSNDVKIFVVDDIKLIKQLNW